MIGLKPLLNDSKVSSPSMPGRPVRVCQLQWFPSCLRHHLSPWGSICESWRVASVLPACDFHSLAHSAAVLQWASIQPATGRYCPFSLSFHTAHCYQLPIWRTYYQPTKNHSGALEKERSGMGGPSLFHLPCGIQRIPLHLQTCDVGIPSSGTFWSSLCSFFFYFIMPI